MSERIEHDPGEPPTEAWAEAEAEELAAQWAREQGLAPLSAGGEADRMQSMMAAVLELHVRTAQAGQLYASEETMQRVVAVARLVPAAGWDELRAGDPELIPGGVVLGVLGIV
ncbi:hypothetical protein [Micrococcus luteus]|uniref:hypothetical protein n=1 Tax=Micrococcus luteus TaxID=1270 RepID=UPI0011A5DEA2|nr:hypothetical protein [Micrococcus luteus]